MKWLYQLLLRLVMAVLLVASILGMLVTFPLRSKWFDPVRDFGNWLVERILAGPHMVFWFWFGLFWAIIAIGGLASLLRRRTEGVAIQIEDGRVVILESAIRKYLRSALQEVRNFQVRNIDIYQLRRRLHIDLYAQVVAQARVPEIEEMVVGIVKRSLRDQLGIEQNAVVQLFVTDFSGTRNNDDLVYRRRWEENGEQKESKAQRSSGVDVEPESLAMGWGEEEPELKRPAVTETNENNSESGTTLASDQPKSVERKGLWSLFRRSKDAPTGNEPAQPAEGESPTLSETQEHNDQKPSA